MLYFIFCYLFKIILLMAEQDLLTKTLTFSVIKPTVSKANVFTHVLDGKITALAKMFSVFDQEQIHQIVNSKDPEGKTPLFYACYFNFQNIVMYLMMKGADPFIISQQGQNCFHICAYRGHYNCAMILFQYLRHTQSQQLLGRVKQLMKTYNFKKTDVNKGILVSSDKHLKHVQQRFHQFSQEIHDAFQLFLDKLFYDFRRANFTTDTLTRTPAHYAALSKYTKSLPTAKYLLLYQLKLDGWNFFLEMFEEVQLLEINKDKKIDPRQYHPAAEMCINFLELNVQETQIYHWMKNIKSVQKDVANTQDNSGYVKMYFQWKTPMHLASFAGDFAAVQFFLSIGGNPKIKDQQGKDVLDLASNDMVRKYMVDLKNAAREGDERSFQLLVNCGHKVDGKATIYGIAPIHNALEHTHKKKEDKILHTVLASEADVNVSDSNGWTPLHHACAYGELGAVQTLLARNAIVNRQSNKGYFPIHVAAMHNHPEVIDILIQNEAYVDSQDDLKCTPLHLAAKKGHGKVVQTLYDHGANIYQQDSQGWTALHFAAFYEHKDIALQLCRFDGDRDELRKIRNARGKTPKDLITNPEIKFAFYTLWRAAQEGDLDTVRRLVILGHDVNEATIEKRQTPLIIATIHEHILIVKFLLENGARKEITDKFNKTAADYAKDKQNYKIFRMLDDQLVQAAQ